MANEKTNNAEAAVKRQSPLAAAFGRLSNRERTMIIALLVLGAACAFYFLLLSPGLDRLTSLESDAEQAEEKQNEYSAVILQGAGTNEQIVSAIAAYDETKGKFYAPMMTETLDSTVTGYLMKAGLVPQTLSVSQIEPETPTPFIPPMPAGLPTSAPSESASSEQAAPDETGGAIYSYSVNVTANGKWGNMYKLIDNINGLNGVELTQYSFSGGGGNEKKAAGGAFSMTIKFYVFDESAPSEAETPPEDEIPVDADAALAE